MWDVARRQLRAQRAVERDLPEVSSSPRDSGFPLSATQRRLWRLQRSLGDRALAYNITLPIRLIGNLDDDALRRALHDVLNRHDALRTVFTDDGGLSSQRILAPFAELPAACYEVTRGDIAAEQEWLISQAARRFDLVSGPAFRLAIHRYRDDECLLFLLAHHIILDGRSASVVFGELESLYNGYLRGPRAALPAPHRQHRDFVHWQRDWISSPAAERYLAYWQQQVPAGRLACCAEAGPADYAGGRVRDEIPGPIVERVGSLAEQENVTIAAVYLAVFLILLHSVANSQPIVGIPAANRGRPELAGVVGYLVNVLPITVGADAAGAARRVVHDSDRALGNAYAYQAMPLEHVVEYCCDGRCAALPFDAFFVAYRENMDSGLRLHSLRRGANPFFSMKDAEFPIMLTVVEGRDRATAMWSYRSSDYSEADAGQLAGRYIELLDAVTLNPDRPAR